MEHTVMPHDRVTGDRNLLPDLRMENGTMMANTTDAPVTPSQSIKIVEIVVPIVVILLLILIGVLVFVFCVVRKKRQTEGTYRPSAEEQTGARSVEAPNTLKLPKEERLI